ncbi:MAG: SDR family NAD(P)-dependent oxidoreductase, partial [Kangiellaceae bacterium]|nr:SDR family NAD(P)-dependent oxidoreductase [Kangiellaceae bacterium]
AATGIAVDILVNNAGIASFGYFDDTSEETFNRVLNVNLQGVVLGCRHIMPLLEKSSRGLIVNVASIFGIMTMPMMSPYHASKFAVRGFTEALQQDLKYQNKNVDALCVMPGGIKTNIAKRAVYETSVSSIEQHFDKLARTTPAQAAEAIIGAIEGNCSRLFIGLDAKIVQFIVRLLPGRYSSVLNRFLGIDKVISREGQ